jgi:hypothetical protein
MSNKILRNISNAYMNFIYINSFKLIINYYIKILLIFIVIKTKFQYKIINNI